MRFNDEELAPYQGSEPYIFFSYSHKDAANIAGILRRMKQDGYRVWYDEGLLPGKEWDDNVALKLHQSSFVVSLMSTAYLESSNCRDELKFARDHEKKQLIIFLEEVSPSLGIEMRFSNIPAVHRNMLSEDEFYCEIYRTDGLAVCRSSQLSLSDPGNRIKRAPGLVNYDELCAAAPGGEITFGRYPTDADGRPAPISWLVLAREKQRLLVISKLALDCQPYNPGYGETAWELCSLRTWLNEVFLNTAFQEDEQAVIPTVTVKAAKNPDYGTNPGHSTEDRLFLPDDKQFYKYSCYEVVRDCRPTPYAREKILQEKYGMGLTKSGCCWWWLRLPGECANHTVLAVGSDAADDPVESLIFYSGFPTKVAQAIRPMLWIDLTC